MQAGRGRLGQIVQRIRKAETLTKVAVVVLVGSVIAAVIGHIYQYGTFDLGVMFRDFYSNASTEAISIAITVLVIDQLNRRREDRLAEKSLKERLIRELGSTVHDVAINAAEELWSRSWWRDGSLQGALLQHANLQGANLFGIDLQGANLFGTNLQGVILAGANLQGAQLGRVNLERADLFSANLGDADLAVANLQGVRLVDANLQGAVLVGVDLQGTSLIRANLQGASLQGSNLQGADLRHASLQGAHLDETEFDLDTVLPDGTKWAPEADLGRFTDPKHPNFWRSDNPNSPAFRSKKADSGTRNKRQGRV